VTTSSLRPTWATPKLHDFKHQHVVDFEQLRCYTLDNIRLYENADGILFPSVTHALGDGKKDSLDAWRQRIGIEEADKIGRRAAAIGTRLHTMCERFLDNRDDYNRGSLPEETELFVKIKPVLTDRVRIVYAQEFPLYSLDLGVAGRCDLYCSFDGEPTVVDFKSSSKTKKEEWIENYFMQATAYTMMLRERGVTVDNFAILVASPEGMQVFHKKVDDYIEMTRDYFKSYHARHGHTQEYFRSLIERNETCT
jgi:hypothetical protein